MDLTLPLYPASIVILSEWVEVKKMVMITLFSHDAFRESFLLLWPCIFTFFLKRNHFPPPFPARCGLETQVPLRSNTVSRPPLVCSFHPPLLHSSTSTLMMPVKGFLPNLSALMFASVLSHTSTNPKINVR